MLMQPDVDALGLVYIWRVRQVKVLRSPGTSPCASSTNLQIWLDEMLLELQAARNLADGVCVEAGFRVKKKLNYPRKLNQRTWTNCWSLRHVFRPNSNPRTNTHKINSTGQLGLKSETGKKIILPLLVFFLSNMELCSRVAWSHGRRVIALACTEAWVMISDLPIDLPHQLRIGTRGLCFSSSRLILRRGPSNSPMIVTMAPRWAPTVGV
jgi:hypothetical protein